MAYGIPGPRGIYKTARRCQVIQEMDDRRSPAMVQRYTRLTAGHLAPYAESIAADTTLAWAPSKAVEGIG